MLAIEAKIAFGDTGNPVANLITALTLLLKSRAFDSTDPRNRITGDELKQLAATLEQERAQQYFGAATRQLVLYFQMQQGLGEQLGGIVDAQTAAHLNDALRRLGVQPEETVYEVFGLVVDGTGRRLAGVAVRAFDRDVQRETLLGQGPTDSAGAYRIVFPESLYRKTAAERGGPDLIARAFDAHGLLLGESKLAANSGARTELNITAVADLMLVSGTVCDETGRALAGIAVRAFDRDLRHEQLLGAASTDARGRYQISYTTLQFRRSEKGEADLVVRALRADGEPALAESALLFNAPRRAVVDLKIPAQALNSRSEWERYGMALAPLLEQVPLRDLTAQDLDFLAGETGFPREHLRLIHLDGAWRAQLDKLRPAPSAFYGLLRQGLPDNLPALLRATPRRWREALKQALAQGQVPSALGAHFEDILNTLTALAVDAAFVAPPSPATPMPVGVLLSASDVPPEIQRQIVAALLHIDAEADEAEWMKMLEETGIPVRDIDSTRFALQSFELLGSHLPTLAELQRPPSVGYTQAADLASLSRSQWLTLAETLEAQKALPADVSSAVEHATRIADRVERVFPTLVYAWQLAGDAEPQRQAVGEFLLQRPGFDLLRTPVGSFKAAPPEIVVELGKEARLARLVPGSDRFRHTTTLLGMGVHSAVQIASLGRAEFVSRAAHAMSAAEATTVYDGARARTSELALHTVRLRDYLDPPIPVLPHVTIERSGDLGTWADNFGNQNGCYCPPCESAHGPAAYLMDLFEFLKDKVAVGTVGRTLLDILFERRPDLQYLKLDCPNAMTPLPYIDLVIELLESHIAGAWDDGHTPQTPALFEGETDVAAHLRALPQERTAVLAEVTSATSLAVASYPWNWPFEPAFQRARVDFALLGISPAAVLELCAGEQAGLQRARLGISAVTWAMLHDSQTDDTAQVAHAWGVPSLEPLLTIGTASGLLARSGIKLDELFALLASDLFAGWSLHIDRSADPCDLDQAKLRQLPPAATLPGDLDESAQAQVLDLLHRLLRLRLALGWPLAQLTTALRALGAGSAARSFDLTALGRVVAIAARTGASLEGLAQMLLALAAPPSDAPGAAAAVRGEWLALLQVAATDHADLVALGLPDTLADVPAAERLARTEAALDSVALLRRADIDPAELRYLLRSDDRIPGVFAPRAGEHIKLLDGLNAEIRAAAQEVDPDVPAAARRARQVSAIVERLGAITGASFVVDVIAADLNVADPTVARPALLAATAAGVAGGVVEDFIANSEIVLPADDSDAARDAAAFETMRRETAAANSLWRVTKTCRLLELLKMTGADVKALTQLPALFDFNRLPPAQGASAALDLPGVTPLIEVALTQRAMPATEVCLLDVLAHASSDADAAERLEAITGWGNALAPRSAADAADGAHGAAILLQLAADLHLAASADGLAPWQLPATYARLQAATAWMKARRLSASSAGSDFAILRAAAQDAAADGAALLALARARFASTADYYAAITPAMDRLRVARRDSLIARIVHGGPHPAGAAFNTADDIYEHLLIDVQMGPCQLTSRIVQAHSAVQLFVQRCLMNLETDAGVLLGDVSSIEEWRQWDWMKRYRVWEAARKVFLYPENWIEPELRDVKSPFFEELETELLQDEITTATAERAVRGYLQKLHGVAKLDVRALYEETVEETHGDGRVVQRRIIHVIGRTPAEPHTHYYRRRLADLSWTPWEKLDLSINADHIALVVFNHRPTLFWPQWKEVQLDRTEPPRTAFDMQLNWSTRDFAGWSAPSKSIDTYRVQDDTVRQRLSLRAEVLGDRIRVLLYQFMEIPRGAASESLGLETCRTAFVADPCVGTYELAVLERQLLRLLPPAVMPHRQALVESIAGPSPTYLRAYSDATIPLELDLDPAMLSTIMTLIEEGGLGGLIVGLIIAGSVVAAATMRTLAEDRAVQIFRGATEGFVFVPCQQYARFAFGSPFVLQQGGHALLALRTELEPPVHLSRGPRTRYVLESAQHPFACDLIEALETQGLAGLYRCGETSDPLAGIVALRARRHPRQLTSFADAWIAGELNPNTDVVSPIYPAVAFDFAQVDAYGLYNWELFFHVPLLIAGRLSLAGKHEDAQKWLHFLFDPTDTSAHGTPQKFWRVKPLFEAADGWRDTAESLAAMMMRLSAGARDVERQVAAWRNDPFNPHLLARLRLVAYMKAVVQKYIENLSDWADSLFRGDTIESINEATQLYVLGSEILGPAPAVMPPLERRAHSYRDLSSAASVDSFANVLVGLEDSMPIAATDIAAADIGAAGSVTPGLGMLYFCIPSNARLRELREKIADRLFKIRHCMDIDGQSRQLALFAPPIDPALLVRARAAGLDIGAAISLALGAGRPHYRFQLLLQKAGEFTGEVRSFGASLLSALEKSDGEQLARLRARHEVNLLALVTGIKRQQVEEARANLAAARNSQRVVEARLEFHAANLAQGRSAAEDSQITLLHEANAMEVVSAAHNILASVFHILPTTVIGFPPALQWGGPNLGHATQAAGSVFSLIGRQLTFEATMSGYNATYGRRADEWRQQVSQATRELAQIEQQIVAAEIRVAMAEREQRNHDEQIAQSEEAETFLREKFTNAQLYNWMCTQLSALHYQAYRMAFDLARQAQSAASYELDVTPDVIGLGHWDSGRKGMLAGERLAQDLRRLELAYLQANKRRYELTSHISLRRLDALALINLRLGGQCAFRLPAEVLALDFPGQTGRRIKSISISIPGVVGPYVGVHGKLDLTQPDGFTASIVTSTGSNDAGVFQLDFRDERYLPFEGVSLDSGTAWEFALPAIRAFDYGTISDVILHVQYTAKEDAGSEAGGPRWSSAADSAAPWSAPAGGFMYCQLLDLRHDFANEWRLLREGGASQVVRLRDELFPYFAQGRIAVRNVIGPPGRSGPAWASDSDELTLLAEDATTDPEGLAAGFGYLVVQYELT